MNGRPYRDANQSTGGSKIHASLTWHHVDLGSVEAIPLGQGRAYVVGTHEIAVFRQRDGCVLATDNRCPHRGGPLSEGIVGNSTVLCPLHGRKFNLVTGACHGESGGVRVYDVVVIDGHVFVDCRPVECGARSLHGGAQA